MNFHTQCNNYIRSLYKKPLIEHMGYGVGDGNTSAQNAINTLQSGVGNWFSGVGRHIRGVWNHVTGNENTPNPTMLAAIDRHRRAGKTEDQALVDAYSEIQGRRNESPTFSPKDAINVNYIYKGPNGFTPNKDIRQITNDTTSQPQPMGDELVGRSPATAEYQNIPANQYDNIGKYNPNDEYYNMQQESYYLNKDKIYKQIIFGK